MKTNKGLLAAGVILVGAGIISYLNSVKRTEKIINESLDIMLKDIKEDNDYSIDFE